MEKDITNETKAKVFAGYLGKDCKDHNGETGSLTTSCLTALMRGGSDYKLILRPLSEITDEDAVEVAKLALFHPDVENYTTEDVDVSEKIDREMSTHIILSLTCICFDGFLTIKFNGEIFTTDEEMENQQMIHPAAALSVFQYLQSRGYDLPHYLLGGKTLHECNLCIYEPPRPERG